MIISDEQVRLAANYLRKPHAYCTPAAHCDVTEDLLVRVRAVLATLPETREERVNEARQRLEADPPSAEEIAAKIIGRAISDSLR